MAPRERRRRALVPSPPGPIEYPRADSKFLRGPIPRTEAQGIKAGDANIGLQTTQSERVSPIISVVLIAGGIALTVAGARTRPSTK